ncbi:HNH endonuclease signature motif containing protein [Streptomyces sp. Lzd4kr]|nr:HNH endonuclease signature motif containing protein [Streptomyces sp. Lzd4kr]
MSTPHPKRLAGTPLERIQAMTDRTGECWLWTGRLNRDGYAELKLAGRRQMAHRVAYETHVGAIPEGLQLDHLCRVRHCVNPAHLEPVTIAENVRRSAPAQKSACVNGHEYTPDNTYERPDSSQGRRDCRTCIRERSRRYSLRKKGAVA